ncbi:MAG TPA: PDZ domain-containing protein [Gemmatimonadales bacterium]|nr:PDZ domain-containing protein [Gemmatimonadales bacterium]
MTSPRIIPSVLLYALSWMATVASEAQQKTPAIPAALQSAPISNLRYDLTFDSTTARDRIIKVAASFDVKGDGPVLLSFPAWTPGAYELSFFARWVLNFAAAAGDKPIVWDKLDYDTWRVQPRGARSVTIRFDYLADTLDNAMAWARPDFALFNGTNLLPYPEGAGYDFPATVTIKTEPSWLVVTAMKPAGAPRTYTESNYHDLVDNPFFVGRLDYDSMQVSGRWTRLATYPAGALPADPRKRLWQQIGKMIPAESAVFRETPWNSYNVMMIFDPRYGGASALEHQSSHVGIYNPGIIASPLLASITAHEIFHAWNVKRLRPADMWPYDYHQAQPTPWLWESEGVTDYYADLALVRGGIIDSAQFMALTADKASTVSEAPPTALEDASLSTWIHPEDGSGYLYYPKGSLAGLMLDITIRDASDNAHSLDDVLRQLYQTTYKKGRGYTGNDWWPAVSQAAGGRSFAEFNARYIDGRDPYPLEQILPLAGMRLKSDTVKVPRLGLQTVADSNGIVVAGVLPGGPAQEAGVQAGDHLIALGDLSVTSPDFGPAFRTRFGKEEGAPLPIKVRRGADTLTLNAKVRLATRLERRIVADSAANPKAVRIRTGILKGITGR